MGEPRNWPLSFLPVHSRVHVGFYMPVIARYLVDA